MGFIDFTNGEVLTADQMDLVMRQGIMRFADAAARDTALSAVLAEGMMAYLDDTDEVLKYDGTDWIDISGDITGVTAGTALTGGGTSGNVTLDVDTSAVQPNVITTQGDLVIGDSSGDPVRLPVGSADQVLTSDGTTVSFQDAGGGGGITLVNMPFDELISFDFEIPIDTLTRFALVTTSNDPLTIFTFDSSDNELDEITVDRNNPFSYNLTTTAVSKIKFLNNTISGETPILVITDSKTAQDGNQLNLVTITSTQSVTLDATHTAYVLGGGGSGSGIFGLRNDAGAGGGSGFFSTGTVTAGTYTATIGAGGSGGTSDGLSGGTSSISGVSATGGSGGQEAAAVGADGGAGGSGGGGGASTAADGQSASGGAGGTNGGNGASGGGTDAPGAGGSGSGVTLPTGFPITSELTSNNSYIGGSGGNVASSGANGADSTVFGGGGGGATAPNTGSSIESGGDGGNGYILLVEA